MARVRPFNPAVLTPLAPYVALNPLRGRCWKHMLLVPLYQVPLGNEEPRTDIVDARDQHVLDRMLAEHLGGYTKENRENAPLFIGIGRRGMELEQNVHAFYLLYTRRSRRAWRYMVTLQRELQGCTGEEQIFLEQTDAFIAPP